MAKSAIRSGKPSQLPFLRRLRSHAKSTVTVTKPRPKPRPIRRKQKSCMEASVPPFEADSTATTPKTEADDVDMLSSIFPHHTSTLGGTFPPSTSDGDTTLVDDDILSFASLDMLLDRLFRTHPKIFREKLRQSAAEDWMTGNVRDKRFIEREVGKTSWRAYSDVKLPHPAASLEEEIEDVHEWMQAHAHEYV
ncbi:hypothetical protein ONZ45_g10169 [Pleurotus djamor]|nr:hypothetical protein ONZ45_g10169 [Pleurotus djamor]